MATLTEIPLWLRKGEQAEWTRSLADYPASTWNAAYELVGPSSATITGAADGDAFDFEITAAASAALTVGRHQWRLVVDDGASITRVVGEGAIEIEEAAATAPAEIRSHARVMLEGIEAFLEGKMSAADRREFTIAGRSITFYTLEELMMARDNYRREVAKEDRQEARKRGYTGAGKIAARLP